MGIARLLSALRASEISTFQTLPLPVISMHMNAFPVGRYRRFSMSCGKSLCVFVATLLFVPRGWTEQKRQYLDYLKNATNEIYQLENRSVEPSASELQRVATTACKALERLLQDPEFKADLDRFDKKRSKDVDVQNQIRSGLNAFINSFASPETELLLKAGISQQAASDIMLCAAFFHDSAAKAPGPVEFFSQIERLKGDICTAAESMAKAEGQKKSMTERRKLLRKWALGLGGVALAAIDVATEIETAGLATASVAFGAAVLQEALKEEPPR
jgi:hypothetical protein